MKVAYVTVRYGPTIVGGAEQACRQLAEHLAARADVEVEVHTTCALSALTWADELPPGTTIEGGVTVHRHRSVSGRAPTFDSASGPVLADPARQDTDTQRRWLDLQGPVCPDAVQAAVDSDADLVIATPYLYWPTVEVARLAPNRFVMHPAAHDEPPIHLPVFGSVFGAARGLAFYTDAERRVVEGLWPDLAATPQLVCGLGVDIRTASPSAFASTVGHRPYLLYLGRVNDGKGAGLLGRLWAEYKKRHPGPLALVFAGAVDNPPEPHPDVIVTGPLSEELKWSAMAGAAVFVHPSANESFGIVLLESWVTGRPALVNARCAATVEHVRRSGGGAAFGSYAAFEVALDRLLGDPELADRMGAAGRDYVQRGFSWPVVVSRYHRWLRRLN